MVALFQTNWSQTQKYIILHGLFPFSVYFLTTLLFTQYIADCEEGKIQTNFNWNHVYFIGVPLALMWFYFTYFECVQIVGSWKSVSRTETSFRKRISGTFKNHYSRTWNYIDTYLML